MTQGSKTATLAFTILLLVVGMLISLRQALSCRSSDSGDDSPWVIVKADAARQDAKILDAIFADILTNKVLASITKFYGGPKYRRIRYDGFPRGYTPTVPGYVLTPLPKESSIGLRLTVALDGLWLHQPPPKDKFAFLGITLPQRGALLGVYNSGSGTIGGCAVGYEIQALRDGWRVRCAGYFDP